VGGSIAAAAEKVVTGAQPPQIEDEDEHDYGAGYADTLSLGLTERFSGRGKGICRILSLDVRRYERAVPGSLERRPTLTG
jgi:hypothetical protein